MSCHPAAIRFGVVNKLQGVIVRRFMNDDDWKLLRALSKSATNNSQKRGKMQKLDQMHSGYTPGLDQWRDFLRCWREEISTLASPADAPLDFVLPSLIPMSAAETSHFVDHRKKEIALREHILGIQLPRSYKDFLTAYRPHSLTDSGDPLRPIGMFEPADVNLLSIADPDMFRVLDEDVFNSNDDDYYVYGFGQDDATRRHAYIENAILIGRYADAMHNILVLYPDAKSIDGEMEAALLHHSGQYRAPSFAELMRQFAALETRSNDAEGIPLVQGIVETTCASRLKLSHVWWI